MPKITLNRKTVDSIIGKKLQDEKLRDRLAMLGSDPEVVNSKEIQVEIFPNRPDLLSEQGIGRALASFLGFKTGLKEYQVQKSGFQVKVNKNLANIRPYTVCAIVKNLKLDDEKLKEIINVQEKLHITFCRNRKKAAIGIYPLEHIKFPVDFKAMEPEEIVFAPLGYQKEMDGDEILKVHPKGREFGKLLEKYDLYPVFVDANNNVLSLTPIINSDLAGKVTTKTKDVFIEVSGFDLNMQKICLNILVTALADMGGKIYSIDVVYPDSKLTTPDLKPKEMKINLANINKLLGLSLKESQLKPLLAKMGHGYKSGKALIPGYRSDVLHEGDLIEDIAIAYGYENFKEELPNISTAGEEHSFSIFKDKVANLIAGLGLLEVKTYHITNNDVHCKKTELNSEPIELKNSKSSEFNILRSWLLPSLLDVLSKNKHHEYPQNIFEASTVFYKGKSETNVVEQSELAIALCSQSTNFTNIKQVLDYLMNSLGLSYELSEENLHNDFKFVIEGRKANIIVDGKHIGFLGEVHPQVLSNFGLELPVAVLELNLSGLFELL